MKKPPRAALQRERERTALIANRARFAILAPSMTSPALRYCPDLYNYQRRETRPVMVGKVRGRDPDPFANEFAASLRAVYDLSVADANAATIIYSTGQSGNPFSPHYRDLARRWGSGGAGAYIDLGHPQVAGQISLRGSAP